MCWRGVYPRHADLVPSVDGGHSQGTYSSDFCSSYLPLPDTFWTQVCLLAPLDDILTQCILNKTSFFSSHTPLLLSVPVTFKHIAIQSDPQGKIQKTTLATLLTSAPATHPSSFFHFPPWMYLKSVTFVHIYGHHSHAHYQVSPRCLSCPPGTPPGSFSTLLPKWAL